MEEIAQAWDSEDWLEEGMEKLSMSAIYENELLNAVGIHGRKLQPHLHSRTISNIRMSSFDAHEVQQLPSVFGGIPHGEKGRKHILSSWRRGEKTTVIPGHNRAFIEKIQIPVFLLLEVPHDRYGKDSGATQTVAA